MTQTPSGQTPPTRIPATRIGEGLDLWGLLGTLPVPMMVHALDGGAAVRFVNPSFTADFGYLQSDLPDLPTWSELAYPDPQYRQQVMVRWWSEIAARQRNGQVVPPGEYQIRDKAGRPRDVLIGFALQGDLAIVTFQDLTQTRAAEVALEAERNAHEKLAYALTEYMPAGAYTMVSRPGAEQAEFVFVSEKFLQMLGITREETMTNPMIRFARLHPEDRPGWLKASAEAIATRGRFSREGRILVNGDIRWIRAESLPRELDDGSVIWESVLVDIHDLKQTEARLKAVLDASKAFTWNLDLRAQMVHLDEHWSLTHGFGTNGAQMTTAAWFESLHPEDAPAVLAALNALRQGTTDKQSAVYRRQDHTGSWNWMQVHAGISARDAAGAPTMLSGVSFNITAEMIARAQAQEEQAELREQLQRAHQRDTVAQIAGAVAHDLNNLIAVVGGTAELLELQSVGQPALLEGLRRIRRSVDMARDLTAGLGGLGRPELLREMQDLGKLLRDAVDLLGQRRIARHNVRVDLSIPVPPVWANPTEFAQVVVNLAINACDAGPPERPATVKLASLPPDTAPPPRAPDAGGPLPAGVPVALFTIEDTGTGITDDVRARMFRANFTTKGKAGTGLGLLIVSTILQANHAALWVDSRLGQGTTMTVAWPMAASKSADAGRKTGDRGTWLAADPTAELLRGLHVLVVDDLADVGEVLTDMLEAAGAVAVAVSDPKEAAQAISEAPELWSVLVTDLHMEGMDGRALARHASSLEPPLPVVLVTARPDTLDNAPTSEFAAVLSKPVTAARLAHTVQEVYTRSRAKKAP